MSPLRCRWRGNDIFNDKRAPLTVCLSHMQTRMSLQKRSAAATATFLLMRFETQSASLPEITLRRQTGMQPLSGWIILRKQERGAGLELLPQALRLRDAGGLTCCSRACTLIFTCCLVKMRSLPSKKAASSTNHLTSHYGIRCQDALTPHSMYGERVEGEWREGGERMEGGWREDRNSSSKT